MHICGNQIAEKDIPENVNTWLEITHAREKHIVHICRSQNVFANDKEEVKNLKHEIEKLKRNNAEITQVLVRIQSEEIRGLKQKLDDISNNMSEMIVNMETKDNDECNSDLQLCQQEFKFGECDYMCSKEISLKKNVNTRHKVQDQYNKTIISQCSHCKENFNISQDFKDHLKEQLEETQKMNMDYLKNGHKSFVCNQCNFNSNDVDNIRKHLYNRVLNNCVQQEHQQTKTHKSIIGEDFDDFCNCIGPD